MRDEVYLVFREAAGNYEEELALITRSEETALQYTEDNSLWDYRIEKHQVY